MSWVNDPYHRPQQSVEFWSFYSELKTVMDASGHLFINVFMDPSGNVVATDSNGNPIQHRQVKFIVYTYSGTEYPGSQSYRGGIKVVFMDGSFLKFDNSEPVIIYWYYIDGFDNPPIIKPFT